MGNGSEAGRASQGSRRPGTGTGTGAALPSPGPAARREPAQPGPLALPFLPGAAEPSLAIATGLPAPHACCPARGPLHQTPPGVKPQPSPFLSPPWGCEELYVENGGKIHPGGGPARCPSLGLILRMEGGMGTRWCQQTQRLCLCWLLASHPAPPLPKPRDPGLLRVSLSQSCIQPHPAPNRAAHAVLAPARSEEAAAGWRGGARSPGPSGRGPTPERARLSSAENMTSAEASAKGKTFLSCAAGDGHRSSRGWRRSPGCSRRSGDRQSEPCVPSALPGERGDAWGGPWLCPLQMGGRSPYGGTKQGARLQVTLGTQTHLVLGSLQPPLPTPILPEPSPRSLAALAQSRFPSPGQAAQGAAHIRELGWRGPSSDGDMWGGQCQCVPWGGAFPPSPQLFSFSSSPHPDQGSSSWRQRDSALPQFPSRRSVGDAGPPAELRRGLGSKDERGHMTQTLP